MRTEPTPTATPDAATTACSTRAGGRTALAAALLGLALVGGTATAIPAAAGTAAQASQTSQAGTLTVSAYSPAHVPLSRPAVAAKGAVRGFPTGAAVRLQRRAGTGWTTIGTPRSLTAGGAFQFKVTHTREGFQTYRVQVFSGARTLATSATLSTHVHRFSGTRPASAAATTGTAPQGRAGGSTASTSSTAGAINGDLTCYQFTSSSRTQVKPPYRVDAANGIVYWMPRYATSTGSGWQWTLDGRIQYSSVDGSGFASSWWDYGTGNEVRVNEAVWTPGRYVAAYNFVFAGGAWHGAGYSPSAHDGGQFCAV